MRDSSKILGLLSWFIRMMDTYFKANSIGFEFMLTAKICLIDFSVAAITSTSCSRECPHGKKGPVNFNERRGAVINWDVLCCQLGTANSCLPSVTKPH